MLVGPELLEMTEVQVPLAQIAYFPVGPEDSFISAAGKRLEPILTHYVRCCELVETNRCIAT